MAPWSYARALRATVGRLLLLALLLGTVACTAPAASPARAPAPASDTASAPAAPRRLRIAYSELTPGQTITWTAHEAGIFARHGLETELQYISSAQTLAAVLAGEVDLAVGGGYAPINARLAGSDVRIVLVVSNFYPYLLMVNPEIASAADLRGKALGVSRFGSASDVATRVALRHLGLDPEHDVTLIQVGSFQERMAAMRAGAIAGGLVSTPQTVLMRRQGFKTLYDLSTSGEEELLNVAYAPDPWLRANEPAAQAYVDAMLDGIHFAKHNRDYVKGVLQQYLKLDDDEALDDAYDWYVERNQPRVPTTGLAAARVYLEGLASTDPRAAGARPEDFFDLRFLEKARASGLVERLWGAP
jgi:NitT/TauT family transport system substrate-binding protein